MKRKKEIKDENYLTRGMKGILLSFNKGDTVKIKNYKIHAEDFGDGVIDPYHEHIHDIENTFQKEDKQAANVLRNILNKFFERK